MKKTAKHLSKTSARASTLIIEILKHPVVILVITAFLSQLLIPEILKSLNRNDQKQIVFKEFADYTTKYLTSLENVLDLYNHQIVDPKQVSDTIIAYNEQSTIYNSYLRNIKITYSTSKIGYFKPNSIDEILRYRKEIEMNLTKMINTFAVTKSFLSPTLWECMNKINAIIDAQLPQTMERLT